MTIKELLVRRKKCWRVSWICTYIGIGLLPIILVAFYLKQPVVLWWFVAIQVSLLAPQFYFGWLSIQLGKKIMLRARELTELEVQEFKDLF